MIPWRGLCPLSSSAARPRHFSSPGKNPARAEHLISICRENGSEASLALLGQVGEEDKVRLMRSSDCLVYPTRYESFGLHPSKRWRPAAQSWRATFLS